jgi:hypothetical protein
MSLQAVPPQPDESKASRPALPGAGIRTSQDIVAGASAAQSITGLFNSYAPLAYMLPFQALDYIELIAQYNPDYSQAVENITTLANSGHNLFIDGGGTRATTQLRSRLNDKARTIQERHGGVDGLIDKLLRQAATYGAMCGEWIVADDLSGIIDFADVNPKSIRFFFEDNHWAPYQKVNFKQLQEARATGQSIRGYSYVKLNELTFHYYAFNAAPQSPYGTPPFLAALPHISVQQDMLYNMAQVVKKVGMLGIIDIACENLSMLPGETPEQFVSRAKSYLQEYAEAMQQMLEEGGLVHFADSTISATNISGNAAGATNIFKQNEELLFSGLKSMPSVQGRSYSTTETYAGVAYDIIIRNTMKFQRACKRMVEVGYWLDASLGGFNPNSISLEFEPNKTLHRLEIAKAEHLEINNAAAKWILGLIDQVGVAQLLGLNEPATVLDTCPVPPVMFGASAGKSADQGGDQPDEVPPTQQVSQAEIRHMVEEAFEEMMAERQELIGAAT